MPIGWGIQGIGKAVSLSQVGARTGIEFAPWFRAEVRLCLPFEFEPQSNYASVFKNFPGFRVAGVFFLSSTSQVAERGVLNRGCQFRQRNLAPGIAVTRMAEQAGLERQALLGGVPDMLGHT